MLCVSSRTELSRWELQGQAPSHLAQRVWEAIETGRFYIIVDGEVGAPNLGAQEITELRHRRIEMGGAPPPTGKETAQLLKELKAKSKL